MKAQARERINAEPSPASLPESGEPIDPFQATVGPDLEPEYVGLHRDRFTRLALAHLSMGYGVLPVGRCDPDNSSAKPGKRPWVRGRHGRTAEDATRAEAMEMAPHIIRRMLAGERGVLNLGIRLAPGVLGIDVDDYAGKRGGATVAAWQRAYGPLPSSYRVTARGGGGISGIWLYRVPSGLSWPGELPALDTGPSDVELIHRGNRYIVGPGSWHHTGLRYRLYSPDGGRSRKLVLPHPDDLPELPEPWLAALGRKHHAAHIVDLDDTALRAAAAAWVGEAQPGALKRTVWRVTDQPNTRNGMRNALFIAARKARAGVYSWRRAVAEIEWAGRLAYEQRNEPGKEFNEADFVELQRNAITQALLLSDDELAQWGVYNDAELAGARNVETFRVNESER